MGIPTTLGKLVESLNLPSETSQYARMIKSHLKSIPHLSSPLLSADNIPFISTQSLVRETELTLVIWTCLYSFQ